MRFSSVITVGIGDRRGGRATSVARQLAAMAGLPFFVLEVATDSVGQDVASSVNGRAGALLVLDARGGGLDGDRLGDSDAEEILHRVRQPVLVVGPHAHDRLAGTSIVPIDGAGFAALAVPVVDQWANTFPARRVVLLALEPPDPWPADDASEEGGDAEHVAARLGERGVSATIRRRLVTTDAWQTIVEAVDAETDPAMLVVPTLRWPGPTHWHATCRSLIRRASCPVLVVSTDTTVQVPADG